MNADALLVDLRARGVVLVAEGDRLRCRPRSLLTPADLIVLQANKPAIIDRLNSGLRRIACITCHGSRFWLSVRGATICGDCHPPGSPDLVARLIETKVD